MSLNSSAPPLRCTRCHAVLLGKGAALASGLCPFCTPRPDTEKIMVAAGIHGRRGGALQVRKKILIAEQARSTQDMVSFLLSQRGYDVFPASTGREALELLKASVPDLAVLGAELPELSGYDVYKRMKLHPACRQVPVLLLVATSEVFDSPTRTLPDPEFLLSKPFTAHDLLGRVGKILSESPEPAGS
jgi:CheY-like chemotaxis protein